MDCPIGGDHERQSDSLGLPLAIDRSFDGEVEPVHTGVSGMPATSRHAGYG